LSKGFWMGKTQVTQAQWQAVMGNNPSQFKGANRPVECVSWYDAKEFLERANSLIGNTNGERLALPTEAQWEYAARARQTGVYAGGGLDEVAWHDGNSGEKTHQVGKKMANSWGLHDMSGNVWEWCQDWYDKALSGGIDPSGPISGSNRVARGGSVFYFASACRVACRNYCIPSGIYIDGFRVTRISVP
jgi:formylglycine-generating enzyme required for sulfatase activity